MATFTTFFIILYCYNYLLHMLILIGGIQVIVILTLKKVHYFIKRSYTTEFTE